MRDGVRSRHSARSDLLILIAAFACAAVAQVLQVISPYSAAVSAPTVALGSARCVLYVIVGLIIRRQRPGNVIGVILIAAGFATWIPTIEFIPNALPWTLSNLFRLATFPISAHLYVSFPGTRPLRGLDARLVRLTYGYWLLSSLLSLVFFDSASPSVCTDCPANLLLLYPDEHIFQFLNVVTSGGGIAIALAVAWRVQVHWATGSEAVRRAMVPALVAVPVVLFDVIVYLFGSALRTTQLIDLLSGPIGQILSLLPPLAFLAGVLRTQFDRSAVNELLMDLAHAPGLGEMQSALRRSLHDRSIRLLAWSPGAEAWVDERGAVQALPTPSDRVAVTVVEGQGHPLATIVHDSALRDEPVLLSAAATAIRFALDNDRLTATVGAQADTARTLPRGRVTLMYTDIEASTGLLARLGDRYIDLLAEERGMIRRIVRARHGIEVDARADEFFAVFPDAQEAAAAALTITRRMSTQTWPGGVEVRVRIGLHTGEPDATPHGYVGLDVHRVARIGNAAHGGQIVLSDATALTIRSGLPDDARLIELGRFQLRGLPEPDDLHQLTAAELPSLFPPLRAGAEPVADGTASTTEV